MVVGITSDVLYPFHLQQELAQHMPNAALHPIDSPHGHDAFLIEIDALNKAIVRWRRGGGGGRQPAAGGLSRATAAAGLGAGADDDDFYDSPSLGPAPAYGAVDAAFISAGEHGIGHFPTLTPACHSMIGCSQRVDQSQRCRVNRSGFGTNTTLRLGGAGSHRSRRGRGGAPRVVVGGGTETLRGRHGPPRPRRAGLGGRVVTSPPLFTWTMLVVIN
jgi:hypothetical protein